MTGKNFSIKFRERDSENFTTIEQYSTDNVICNLLDAHVKENGLCKISDIEIIQQEGNLLRLDLMISVIRPRIQIFKIGEIVRPIFFEPLPGRRIAPKLIPNTEYPVKSIMYDSKENPHLNVGLISEVNFVTSYETGEELEESDKIHFCHPIRFELVKGKTNDVMQFIKEDAQ